MLKGLSTSVVLFRVRVRRAAGLVCVLSFVRCGSSKVSDCSPANRERELGLDRRETG